MNNLTKNDDIIKLFIDKIDKNLCDDVYENILGYNMDEFLGYVNEFQFMNLISLKYIIYLIEQTYKNDVNKKNDEILMYLQVLFNHILLNRYYDDYYNKNNKSELINYLLEKTNGEIKNDIVKYYVPCNECYNGEQHSCNFRNITLNFYLEVVYGTTLDGLVYDFKSKKKINLTRRHNYNIKYELFKPVPDKTEIYNSPAYIIKKNGKELINLSYYDHKKFPVMCNTNEKIKEYFKDDHDCNNKDCNSIEIYEFIKNVSRKYPYIYIKDLYMLTLDEEHKINNENFIPPGIININNFDTKYEYNII